MASDPPSVIERNGDTWSLRYDLTHLPTYSHMELRGTFNDESTQVMLELIEANRPLTTNEQGQRAPLIYEIHAKSPPTAQGPLAALFLARPNASQGPMIVVQVDGGQEEPSRLARFFSALSGRRPRRSRSTVVGSLDEAIEVARRASAR